MTAQLQNNPMPYLFVPSVIVMRPPKLKSYFQKESRLQIPPHYFFYFWMQEHLSSEWVKSTSPDLAKVVKVFNEVLNPLGKSCQLVSENHETIQVKALDDGFYLSTTEHPFEVIVS